MSGNFTDNQRGALLAMKKWCQDYIDHVDAWIATKDDDAIHQHLDRLDDIAQQYPPDTRTSEPSPGSVKRRQI